MADLISCDLPLVERNAFDFIFYDGSSRMIFSKPDGVGPLSLGVGSSGDRE